MAGARVSPTKAEEKRWDSISSAYGDISGVTPVRSERPGEKFAGSALNDSTLDGDRLSGGGSALPRGAMSESIDEELPSAMGLAPSPRL